MKFKEIKPGMVIHCPTEEDARALLEHLDSLGYRWGMTHKNLVKMLCWNTYTDKTCYMIEDNKDVLYGYLPIEKEITEFSSLIEPEPVKINVRMNTLSEEYAVTKSSDIQPRDADWTKEPPIIWTRCREDWIDGDVKYANAEPWARDGWHKTLTDSPINSPINSDTDSPMTAEEVLEWFHNVDADTIYEVFGIGRLDKALSYHEPDEIIQRIEQYEAAKKAPKPVEVEWVDVLRIYKLFNNNPIERICVHEEVLPENNGCTDYRKAEKILKDYIAKYPGEKYIAVNESICLVKEGE